jgi:signal peptidase II
MAGDKIACPTQMNARVRAILIIAAVILLDRISKAYIRVRVPEWDVIPVIRGFFNIDHTENTGAAFGMFAQSASQLRPLLLIGISLVVMSIIAPMLWAAAKSGGTGSALMQAGLAFVFGGAAGNLWDRLFRGSVTDFLQLFFGSYEFPSFNVADSSIFAGACLLLIDMWVTRKKGLGDRRQGPAQAPERAP